MSPNDNLRLTYIGGPTLLMEFGGVRFLTDPTFDAASGDYTTGPVTLSNTMGPAVPVESMGRIDVVLLSHDHHFDNFDHAGRDMVARAGVVLTTEGGAERLGGNARGLAPWQQYKIPLPDGSVARVTGTPAQHGPAGRDRGPVTGFVLELSSDKTVYISGDTVWFDGVIEILRRFPKIGTGILFMGAAEIEILPGHLTFTAEEAIEMARALPNMSIIPLHFEGWKHFKETREVITQAFSKVGLESRLKWLPAGQSVTV